MEVFSIVSKFFCMDCLKWLTVINLIFTQQFFNPSAFAHVSSMTGPHRDPMDDTVSSLCICL